MASEMHKNSRNLVLRATFSIERTRCFTNKVLRQVNHMFLLTNPILQLKSSFQCKTEGEGENEVAFFSAKCWDRRNRADLIESATPCHDAQVVGLYRESNPLRLTILAAMSEDYTKAPQHLQTCCFRYQWTHFHDRKTRPIKRACGLIRWVFRLEK